MLGMLKCLNSTLPLSHVNKFFPFYSVDIIVVFFFFFFFLISPHPFIREIMTERLLCKIKFYDISRAFMSCMYNAAPKQREGYLKRRSVKISSLRNRFCLFLPFSYLPSTTTKEKIEFNMRKSACSNYTRKKR